MANRRTDRSTFEALADLSRAFEFVDTRPATLLRASARRPDDLFVADLTLHNLRVVKGALPTLVRIDENRDATLVVALPPQSFGEEAFLDATGPEVATVEPGEFPDSQEGGKNAPTAAQDLPELGRTRIRMAGRSRLAFTMPAHVASVPYTINALLQACRTWPVRRALTAAPEPTLPPGRIDAGDLDVLGTVVRSAEFSAAQRRVSSVLRDIATPAAEAAVAAAGRRIAEQAASGLQGSDPMRGAAVVVRQLREEVDALAAKFPALRDPAARAMATVAMGYQAAGALDGMGIAGRPGLEMVPAVPLLTLLLQPYRPGQDVTALELPYRLFTSPIGAARWTHRTSAVARQGRHELWHTRLTTAPDNAGPDKPGALRAIWSEDYLRTEFLSTTDLPFRMPLDAQDRKMLVQLTAGFDERKPPSIVGTTDLRYRPRPAQANRLILSALGGLLDTEGAWTTRPVDVDVEAWRHLASLGRDHYVRVVYAGYLLPFGHAASLIKVTERKFEGIDAPASRTKRVATLRQRFFLVVREPVKWFDGSRHVAGGHPFPFTSVELLTRVTPNLVPPNDAACRVIEGGRMLYQKPGTLGGLTWRQAFWPMLVASTGGDFRFDVAAVDRDGRRITFSLPLMFMSAIANTGMVVKGAVQQSRMANIIAGYNAEGPGRRHASLDGADVCYAPPDPGAPGDPRLPTEWMRFRAGEVSSVSTTAVNSYPECEETRVALRAVQRILGREDAMVSMRYADPYRTVGFGSGNPGEVFLEVASADAGWKIDFGPSAGESRSDAMGAVASPAMSVQGVSRRIGLASDIDQITTNSFDPAAFFKDARILGSIRIAEVIDKVTTGVSGADVPKFVTRELAASGALPPRVEARFEWRSRLGKPDSQKLLIPSADGARISPFEMLAVTTTTVGAPESATTVATATMGNFKVNLFEFIVLWFIELRFVTERGRKPEVAVEMHPARGVEFGGPLEFVNQLKDLIPSSGFSDPAALAVTPSGIAASYSLTIPSVQVGVFALSGLSIGARFSLPFDVRPMEVGFNFAERENPFSLTVSLLGGGGFFAIGIGADGVREIEAALEAGARLAIDLGVASGAVEIKAGIYFHWLAPSADADGVVELAGYVRLHGELDVMGIISASLTFNLQLAYEKTGTRSVVWGEATLTIEIEVLVFSGEVTVRCRREFGGSEADPTFAELVPGDAVWSTYCLAFAEE